MAPEILAVLFGAAGFAVFAAILVFRIWTYFAGLKTGDGAPAWLPDVAEDWPVHTLRIGLKDEAETAPQLAAAHGALDYPPDRLDVKLLIETGDEATAFALRRESWPKGNELHVLPPGLPRTKPRALNYGLATARGEFALVYDAEDRLYPDQFKRPCGPSGRRARNSPAYRRR